MQLIKWFFVLIAKILTYILKKVLILFFNLIVYIITNRQIIILNYLFLLFCFLVFIVLACIYGFFPFSNLMQFLDFIVSLIELPPDMSLDNIYTVKKHIIKKYNAVVFWFFNDEMGYFLLLYYNISIFFGSFVWSIVVCEYHSKPLILVDEFKLAKRNSLLFDDFKITMEPLLKDDLDNFRNTTGLKLFKVIKENNQAFVPAEIKAYLSKAHDKLLIVLCNNYLDLKRKKLFDFPTPERAFLDQKITIFLDQKIIEFFSMFQDEFLYDFWHSELNFTLKNQLFIYLEKNLAVFICKYKNNYVYDLLYESLDEPSKQKMELMLQKECVNFYLQMRKERIYSYLHLRKKRFIALILDIIFNLTYFLKRHNWYPDMELFTFRLNKIENFIFSSCNFDPVNDIKTWAFWKNFFVCIKDIITNFVKSLL